MKIFLNDYTMFNDMSTHLKKIRKYFLKCREHGINLNPKDVHLWCVMELF
jgi:hypothetical protein